MYRLNDEQQRIGATAARRRRHATSAPRAAQVDAEAAFPARVDRGARRSGLPRPDRPDRVRRHGPGPARRLRGPGRGRAALRLHRDGLPDAPLRHRLLRRRAGQDGAATCEAAAAGRHLRRSPGASRLAQPLLGAGQPGRAPATAPCRSAPRSRSSPRPATPTATCLDALAGATAADRDHALPRPQRRRRAVAVAGAWSGLGCAATPARR